MLCGCKGCAACYPRIRCRRIRMPGNERCFICVKEENVQAELAARRERASKNKK